MNFFLKYVFRVFLFFLLVGILLFVIRFLYEKKQNEDPHNKEYFNRKEHLLKIGKKVAEGFESSIWINEIDDFKMPYRYLKPESMGKYPLVIALHNSWGSGTDNFSSVATSGLALALEESKNKYPAYVIVPQYPSKVWTLPEFNNSVFQLIDYFIERYTIDESRIYIGGESMGGSKNLDYIIRRPHFFAGSIIVCGKPPLKDLSSIYPFIPRWLMHGQLKDLSPVAQTPIWFFHGKKDLWIPYFLTNLMVNRIKEAGSDPRYTLYPDLGHISWFKVYQDPNVLEWLFSKTRSEQIIN